MATFDFNGEGGNGQGIQPPFSTLFRNFILSLGFI